MKRGLVAVPVAWVWVVACSSSSGSGDASSASGFGQQFCQLFEPCCADAGLSTSGSVCEAFVSEAESKGTYDASAGQACLDALQSASKSATFCTDLGGNLPACNDVFSSGGGAAAAGQPCMTDSQCAAPAGGKAYCLSHINSVDGGTNTTSTCVQAQAGKAGQGPCVATIQGNVTYFTFGSGGTPTMGFSCNVADGVYCDSTSQKCTALAATGQACQQDQQCVTSDYCAFGSTAGSTCQPRIAVGGACTNGGSNPCVTNAYCDSSSKACESQLATGAACSTNEQCQSGTCNNGKCTGSGNLGLALLCGG